MFLHTVFYNKPKEMEFGLLSLLLLPLPTVLLVSVFLSVHKLTKHATNNKF